MSLLLQSYLGLLFMSLALSAQKVWWRVPASWLKKRSQNLHLNMLLLVNFFSFCWNSSYYCVFLPPFTCFIASLKASDCCFHNGIPIFFFPGSAWSGLSSEWMMNYCSFCIGWFGPCWRIFVLLSWTLFSCLWRSSCRSSSVVWEQSPRKFFRSPYRHAVPV